MAKISSWARQELLVAFYLYCQMPFGKLHSRNPDIIRYASFLGRTPSALAMKLTNIASLDPVIISSGRKGLKGTSASDRAMWDEMQSDWENFAIESYQAMSTFNEDFDTEYFDEDSSVEETVNYTGTEKTTKTKTRVGQEFFRKTVLSSYEYRCCITGLAIPQLLVASHIIPWKTDSSNRLNPRNGLSLSMLHDKAFDRGIITISENMTVRVTTKKITRNDSFYAQAIMGYQDQEIFLPEKFQPHTKFLAYHREQIFEKTRLFK